MYSKSGKTETSIMTDMLIVLLVLAAVSVYYYGLRAALVIAITVGVCCITDFISIKLRKKDTVVNDISAFITGLTLSMMLPASVPYYEAVIAAVFAIVIAKQAFGGHGCEIFNAAAAGFLFISLCFPENILTYPMYFEKIPFSSLVPSDMLKSSMVKLFITSGSPSVSAPDLLVGKFSGPMGTGFVAILLVAAVFLALRRSVSAIALSAEVVVSGIAVFLLSGFDPNAVLTFFAGGMTLFVMIFLSCEYSSMPQTRSSRLLYGILVGGLTVLLQYYSKTENAIVYAVIIAAPFGIELDRKALSFAEMLKNRRGLFFRSKPLKHVQETLDILDKNDEEK